jgi:hypothetical protein
MTDSPDPPEVMVTRTRRGFAIDMTALRTALEGGVGTVTFTAPDGYVFGEDRRLHEAGRSETGDQHGIQ